MERRAPLLPASLHKGSVQLRRPYRGGGLLEKLARARWAFPGLSSQDWVRTLGREGGAAGRGASFPGGLSERRLTSHTALKPSDQVRSGFGERNLLSTSSQNSKWSTSVRTEENVMPPGTQPVCGCEGTGVALGTEQALFEGPRRLSVACRPGPDINNRL